MFERDTWFAWFPVQARTRTGPRLVWLTEVMRERFTTDRTVSKWRYYA